MAREDHQPIGFMHSRPHICDSPRRPHSWCVRPPLVFGLGQVTGFGQIHMGRNGPVLSVSVKEPLTFLCTCHRCGNNELASPRGWGEMSPPTFTAQSRPVPPSCPGAWGEGCLGLQGQETCAKQNTCSQGKTSTAIPPVMRSPPSSWCPSQNASQIEADTEKHPVCLGPHKSSKAGQHTQS